MSVEGLRAAVTPQTGKKDRLRFSSTPLDYPPSPPLSLSERELKTGLDTLQTKGRSQ